jgi:hypothetical protein
MYQRVILKKTLITVACILVGFVTYYTVTIVNKIFNDTILNNKILEENEIKYKKIIHPKDTKSLAFKNKIVAPPSTGHQCWFLIEELRVIVSNIDFVNISNKYKALNGELTPEIYSLSSSSLEGSIVKYDISQLENEWNINIKGKNLKNLYLVHELSSGKEDADLRCL